MTKDGQNRLIKNIYHRLNNQNETIWEVCFSEVCRPRLDIVRIAGTNGRNHFRQTITASGIYIFKGTRLLGYLCSYLISPDTFSVYAAVTNQTTEAADFLPRAE